MKKHLFSLLVSIALTSPAAFCQTPSDAIAAGKNVAVVSTDNGKLRGYIHKGIYTYKGIPYAQADRFMPPSKPASWTDVRTALSYGPVCPTDPTTTVNDAFEFPFNHDWGYSNEHCHSLNVWTPVINDGKKRPVMIWLHGGGFSAGSAIEQPGYDGENLSKKGDVVVVSINHRLNVLGFLDLSAYGDKYKSSANVGMMDIVAALQWVKENIAAFGGDPNNVTIFGQSGGGGKVTTLMAMPGAKGLFHRAVAQSGSTLRGATRQSATEATDQFLTKLGIQKTQIERLQQMPWQQLEDAFQEAKIRGLAGGPVVDGTSLPRDPWSPTAPDPSASVPLMMGSVQTENAWIEPPPPLDMSEAEMMTRVVRITRNDETKARELVALYRR